MIDTFIELFGEYEPIITELNGVQTISCNWSYIFMMIFIAIVLNSVLRVIGGIICAR